MPKLTPAEQIIFDEILEERDPLHWTPHRRAVAAICARELYRLQQVQEQLMREPSVVRNGRGNPVINPLYRVMDKAFKSVIGFRRSLAIDARSLGGEKRDIARRHGIRLEQQRAAPRDYNGLLAIPGALDDARR